MPSRKDNPDWIEKVKRRVRLVFDEWRRPLELDLWSITFEWDPGWGPSASDQYMGLMSVDAHWEYRQATIKIWSASVNDLNNSKLEEALVHELTHCLVSEMRDWGPKNSKRKHEERVVTQLTDCLLSVRKRAYDQGFKKGQRAARPKKRRAAK